MDQKQFQRLPVYARDAWVTLMTRVSALERTVAALTAKHPTRVQLDPFASVRNKDAPLRYLREQETIRYTIDGGFIDVRLTWENDVAMLAISGDTMRNDGPLSIRPRASNLMHITFDKERSR